MNDQNKFKSESEMYEEYSGYGGMSPSKSALVFWKVDEKLVFEEAFL